MAYPAPYAEPPVTNRRLFKLGVPATPELCPMSSRLPDPIHAGALHRAAANRNRRDRVALRRAAAQARDEGARQQVHNLRSGGDTTRATLSVAGGIVRRALLRHDYPDQHLIDRLANMIARIELHRDAACLEIKPDDLAEVRMLARKIALKVMEKLELGA